MTRRICGVKILFTATILAEWTCTGSVWLAGVFAPYGVDLHPIFAYMVVTILWATLVTNLIEIGENDRMRWEIGPLLVVLLGCVGGRRN